MRPTDTNRKRSASLGPLTSLGFTKVADFQAAWNLGAQLVVDGVYGPATEAAAEQSWERHKAGQGDLSEHFSAAEFACHCHGSMTGCRRLRVMRPLLTSLESLRKLTGPITVVSGYRCGGWNAHIGGKPNSQHLTGAACDPKFTRPVTRALVINSRLFSGIGFHLQEPFIVSHVDRRDIWSNDALAERFGGSNPTGSTRTNPARFIDG